MRRLLTRWLARLHGLGRDAYREVYLDEARRRYHIASTARFGYRTELYGPGKIVIGERSYFGNDCYLSCYPGGATIKVGACCAVAHNVHIRTSDFRRTANFADAFDAEPEHADIEIGDYVWIGAHVYICAGVKIGRNSIIGANSVVTHDVPPDTVVGGVPARVLHVKASYER
jgi:maltose O-acetyltransferase